MNKQQRLYLLYVSLLNVLCAIILSRPVLVRSDNLQQIAAFLEVPYYGATTVSSIFDHNQTGGQILALTGATADSTSCPCPDAPVTGCIDGQFARGYYSCDTHSYLYYDNHSGIDYILRYAKVRAAASGEVIYAGWNDAANHGVGGRLGLYVRMNHDNNYNTFYGHLSVLLVRSGDEITASADEFSRIIGISGNTGDSTGAHLHFQVQDANGVSVDPYGPDGNPDHKLWIERPAIAPHDIYTSGNNPLDEAFIPEEEIGYFTIDDGDADFVADASGCWTSNIDSGWSGDYLSRNVPNAANCTAAWNFPQTQRAGYYHTFVHIPNDENALANRRIQADSAMYTITHAISADQPWAKREEIVIVNQ